MMAMNGRPNKRNGRLASAARYRAATVLASAADTYFFFPNAAMAFSGEELGGPGSCQSRGVNHSSVFRFEIDLCT